MRRHRFKVDDLGTPARCTFIVSGNEAHHALHVLRLTIGEKIVLFDGNGRQVDGRISRVSPSEFEVERFGELRESVSIACPLTLAVAVPKGQRADWMVEKCAELGVGDLRLLQTERGSVIPGEGKLSRWKRKATAAAKQAGLSRVMDISPPCHIPILLNEIGPVISIVYGDPHSASPPLFDTLYDMLDRPAKRMISLGAPPLPGVGNSSRDCSIISGTSLDGQKVPEAILFFIGPEGGFTDQERELIEQYGGKPVRLADSILRIETAAVAVASLWACRQVHNRVD